MDPPRLQQLVLIESDWNLKKKSIKNKPLRMYRINRIRLEFKVYGAIKKEDRGPVLIESDWNLKILDGIRNTVSNACINRIRLEFKVLYTKISP